MAPASGRRSTTWRAWCETGAGWPERIAIQAADNPTERREEVYATTALARDALGFTPAVALPEGVARYLDWLRAELADEVAR